MFLTETQGWSILLLFGSAMFVVAWLKTRRDNILEGFLVANRRVPLLSGAFSIAVSWIWAPAVFICSMQAYTKGIPGIFWFTFPNIICFFIFAPLALRLRKTMPGGYTFPQYIARRFGGQTATHLAFLIVFFGYQLGALVINCVAGGTLMHAICGINIQAGILGMSITAVAYSLLSGLRASVFTDIIQMAMILVVALIIVPWCIFESGGLSVIRGGLAGVKGIHGNIFDPWIAYTMGIPMTLGLIAGPIADQMFFQRAMAVRTKSVVNTFILGGLLFAVVPITLSLLGFIAANPLINAVLPAGDPQIIGATVVGHFLPTAALLLFCIMAIAGLTSTLDSAFCASSSLAAIDIYKHYRNANAKEARVLAAARVGMILMALLGTAIALLVPKLLWVFLIYGALASAGMFPIVLALFWRRLPAKGAFWAVMLSLAFGTPLSIYANIRNNPHLVVLAAVVSVAMGLMVCLLSGFLSKSAPPLPK